MAIEWMVNKYGINHVGLLTLSFGVPGSGRGSQATKELRELAKDLDFVQKRWASFRSNVIAVRYKDWICILEPHKDGVWHIHVRNHANTRALIEHQWQAGLLAAARRTFSNATNANQRKPVSCVIAPPWRRLVLGPSEPALRARMMKTAWVISSARCESPTWRSATE
jgi:hypothetical protein